MSDKEIKEALVKHIFAYWEDTTQYRWDDVLDYICDHWSLDEEWDNYFEQAAKELYNMSFEACCYLFRKAEKQDPELNAEALDVIKKITHKIESYLQDKLEKDLEKLI